MENSIELGRELRCLKNDKLMTERAIECQKRDVVEQLKGSMGEDMLAVLNGEKRIELGKLEKTKFKFSMFLRRIFRMF
jgi:hypothetical protein